MLTNRDCILLLSEINDNQANDLINTIIETNKISQEVLSYIHSKRPLSIIGFYEYLRKSYNKKHSKIYINIVKEIDNPNDVLTTLSSLLTQILLYSNRLEDDRILFLNHSRANEITEVLNNYFETYDITKAIRLLKLIKADLMAFEYINGKRD